MKIRLLALPLALLLGCSDDHDTAACQPASRTVLDAIEEGLTVSGGGELREGQVVPAEGLGSVAYVVAAEIDGPGIDGDGDIGAWGVGDLKGGGPIYAANAVAREMSDWGSAAVEGSAADDFMNEIRDSAEADAAAACM